MFSEKKKKNAANAESGSANTNTAEQPPNQILFLTNLPEETNEMMLSMVINDCVIFTISHFNNFFK